METKTSTVKQVDTVQNGGNGYPRGLRTALTASTMCELRELHDEATKAGHEVNVVILHRRDGWGMWERANIGSVHDLDDDYWMSAGDDTIIDVDANSDDEQQAYDLIVGEAGDMIDGPKALFDAAKRVKELAEELNCGIEGGEVVRFFFNDNNKIKYSVRTGDNGYHYDTHQYMTALEIIEREEEEEDGDDEA